MNWRSPIAVAVVLAATACSSVTAGTAVPGDTQGPAAPSTTSALPTSAASTTPVAPAPVAGFQSPSGNIRCLIAGSTVRCDIAEHSYDAGPTPASCTLSYGGSVHAGLDDAGFGCVGDALPAGPTLPYGQSVELGGITCSSERDGVTCVTASGRGFTLARAAATFR